MSHRIAQLNSVIKKELGNAILTEIDLAPSVLATITQVKTSQDLSQVRVFVSVLPENKRDLIIKTLQKNRFKLQSFLNSRLHLKKVPKLYFSIDVSQEKAERINKLLDRQDC